MGIVESSRVSSVSSNRGDSLIIECFNEVVVSWTIDTILVRRTVQHNTECFLGNIDENTRPSCGPLCLGGRYRWPCRLWRMHDANLIHSMYRKSCSPANAAYEDCIGRLKNELFYPRACRSVPIERLIEIVDKYIRGYNEKWNKTSLGSVCTI